MNNFLTLLILLITNSALSQSGNIDLSFGTNGKVNTSFGINSSNSKANAIAVQSDGKIIVGGNAYTANTVNSWQKDTSNFSLVRYNSDGSVDKTFGNEGFIMEDFKKFYGASEWFSDVLAIKLQPDGKIVTYGGSYIGYGAQTVVLRHNADGSLDTTFGNNGQINCNSLPIKGGESLLLQPDGKIVVLGYQYFQPSPTIYHTQFVLERYNSDGSIDNSFAENGRAVTVFGPGYDTPKAITLQPDGKIIAVGSSFNSLFAIARYSSNGLLDTTFDGDGKVITSFGAGTNGGIPNFVSVEQNGKIIVAGYVSSAIVNTSNYFGIAHYNINGSLDTSFDGDGKATHQFGLNDNVFYINSVIKQSDDKFLVTTASDLYGGYTEPQDFVTRRYNGNGTPDTTFGTNGKASTTFLTGFNSANYVAIQQDLKIIVVGHSTIISSGLNDFNIARYESNGNLDLSFENDGKITTKFDTSNDDCNILLVQPDDKLISFGIKKNYTDNGFIIKDIAISRHTANGSPDSTFGVSGKIVIANQVINKINTAILQSDGKIVLSNSYYQFGGEYVYELIRLMTSGEVDLQFGTNGHLVLDEEINMIVSQTDGKLLLVYNSYNSITNTPLIKIKRINTNGTLDLSFDSDGIVNFPSESSNTLSAVMQNDGKTLISYTKTSPNGMSGLYSIRINSNGSLDTNFINNVVVEDSYTNTVKNFIQPDGKIIVTGKSLGIFESYQFNQFVMARYNTDGSIDGTFGNNGVAVNFLGSYFEPYTIIQSLVLQPDGKFLIALSKTDLNPSIPEPNTYDIVLKRINPDGTLDNEFGVDGIVTTSLFNKYDEAFGLVLQSDNKIVIGGTTDTGINRDFALIRLENSINLENKDFDKKNELVLYPNPTNNKINFKFNDNQNLKFRNFSITNLLGQTIYTDSFKYEDIDVSHLNQGIYQVKLETDKGSWSGKFIKN